MTIRLRCVQCSRELNVPETAVGKTVQCPACGARFIGQTEQTASPLATSAQVMTGQPAAVVTPRPEVEVMEGPQDDKEEQAKTTKPGLARCGCLVGAAVLLLLGCAGLSIPGYFYFTGYIADKDWKMVDPEQYADCHLKMPGDPVHAVDNSKPGVTMNRYDVEKPLARSSFQLLVYDVPSSQIHDDSLDKLLDEESANLSKKLGASVEETHTSPLGFAVKGKEARLSLGMGRYAVVRVYMQSRGPKKDNIRVYELLAIGPFMKSNRGVGNQFFNSFAVIQGPVPGNPGPRQ